MYALSEKGSAHGKKKNYFKWIILNESLEAVQKELGNTLFLIKTSKENEIIVRIKKIT